MASDYRSTTVTGLPRGIRNNNPGNIKAGDSWQGMVGQDAGGFIIFQDMSWGTRAIARSLTNMINKGLDTIQTLITTWSLTDQAAYVSNVSSYTGIPADEQLGTDPDTISGLIRAIVIQENGAQYSGYVTDQDIADGMSLASGGVATIVQAAAIDATNYPLPYVLGAAALAIAIWWWSSSRRK